MGVYMVAVVYGIPALIFIIWAMTPRGKQWRRDHDML